jgi:hypothetical protein
MCRSRITSAVSARFTTARFRWLRFPAIAEADEVHQIETIWDPNASPAVGARPCIRRVSCSPFCTISGARWASTIFCRPVLAIASPLGGGLVKAEWFKRYSENEPPERLDSIVQSWVIANKATELSDYSVCTTWGVKDKNVYLLGLLPQRLEYPALNRAVREQQNLYHASEILIEDKASGTQLIQELIDDGCHGVTRYQPDCDKIMRLHAQPAMIETGFVFIP